MIYSIILFAGQENSSDKSNCLSKSTTLTSVSLIFSYLPCKNVISYVIKIIKHNNNKICHLALIAGKLNMR